MIPNPFVSKAPEVRLERCFASPVSNAIAAARTCYSSKGIVTTEQAEANPELRNALAKDLYKAGHHTVYQHAYAQFTLNNVSRQFVWSFLHSHQFYNSEQVSQRYVAVTDGNFIVPRLDDKALSIYLDCVKGQFESYERLCALLKPAITEAYFARFPARAKNPEAWKGEIGKRCQEVARYVLPVATFTYLYHTVSMLTLLRYWKMCATGDVPHEQQYVVGQMVQALMREDPNVASLLEDPMLAEDCPEAPYVRYGGLASEQRYDFDLGFHREYKHSVLYGASEHAEDTIATAVTDMLGLPRSYMDKERAIGLVMDPQRNKQLGLSLNVGQHSKLLRALQHVHFTFKKRLSHTADSQDQRHRMTPASRPILAMQIDDTPSFITPEILLTGNVKRQAYEVYTDSMEWAWMNIGALIQLGVSPEYALYLLPNATTIRFTESADLLSFMHKARMRLCFNAQEEIWRATTEEVSQIAERFPTIGKYLLAPCQARHKAGMTPYCPEGKRYCGVPLWRGWETEERLI